MIRLSKPYIPQTAIDSCAEVIRSGNLVQGKYVQQFEESLSQYLEVKHTIVVSSGTAALHLSLLALGIGKGDEVIVPAFTFPATANVVELTGATPVFSDINLTDFCIDVSAIESLITSKTRAIMPVHEFGQAADMAPLMEIADRHHLLVLEDAACALGTEYMNKKAGNISQIGCYSFHPRKAITTGEGGAVVTNDDNLAEKIRSLRNHGIEIRDGKADFTAAGLNYRMTDFQAALGYFQMLEIDGLISKRRMLAEWYDARLSGMDAITTPKIFPDRKNVYQSYHILLDSKIERDMLKKQLLDQGIETNYGANALEILSFYKEKYGSAKIMFPNALFAFQHGLALPMSHQMTEQEVNTVSENLKSLTIHGK